MTDTFEFRIMRETYVGIGGWLVTELPYGPYKSQEAAEEVANRFKRPRKAKPAHNDHGDAWVEYATAPKWQRLQSVDKGTSLYAKTAPRDVIQS